MAYGKLILEDEKGKRTKVPLGFSVGMLFFGPLVPAWREQWLHFIFSIVLLIGTLGLSWIIYPFYINFAWRQSLLRRGYRILGAEYADPAVVKKRTGIDVEFGQIDRTGTLQKHVTFVVLQLLATSPLVIIAVNDELNATHVDTSSITSLQSNLEQSDPEDNEAMERAHRLLYRYYRDEFTNDNSNKEAERLARYHKERMDYFAHESQVDRYCVSERAKQEAYDYVTGKIDRDAYEQDKVIKEEASYIGYRHFEFKPYSEINVSINRETCEFNFVSQYTSKRSLGLDKVEYERVTYQANAHRGGYLYYDRKTQEPQLTNNYWQVWRVEVTRLKKEKSDDGTLWE